MDILKKAEKGAGPTLVILHENQSYTELVAGVAQRVPEDLRTVILECPVLNSNNWLDLSNLLLDSLRQHNVRYASFVGLGEAGILLQRLALRDMRMLRRLVLLDPSHSPHPNWLARKVAQIEEFFPLGLPLRSPRGQFDSRSFLHSIRCPVLLTLSRIASTYHQQQVKILGQLLPTAWTYSLTTQDPISEFAKLILDFQEVAARCPQKVSA